MSSNTKKLRSGELATILGVTVQSISNFRNEGMPYTQYTTKGYIYDLTALKWYFMFKTQCDYHNKRYKLIRKHIKELQEKNKHLQSLLEYQHITEEQKNLFIIRIKQNNYSISKLFSRL